jgi:hypothetical protein
VEVKDMGRHPLSLVINLKLQIRLQMAAISVPCPWKVCVSFT